MKSIVFLVLALIYQVNASAINVDKEQGTLWAKHSKAKGNAEQEVLALIDLALFYVVIYDDRFAADTLSEKAILIANSTNDLKIISKAYEAYFNVVPTNVVNPRSLEHAEEFLQLAKKNMDGRLFWFGYYYKATALYNSFKFKNALNALESIKDINTSLNDVELKISYLVFEGQCYEKLNDKMKALALFLEALDLANHSDSYKQKMYVLDALAIMFHFNKSIEKALEYRLKKVDLILQQSEIDSIQWLTEQFYLLELNVLNDGSINPEPQLDSMLAYTKSHGYAALYYRAWSLYRSYLIPSNKFEKLYILYNDLYPEELEKIKVEKSDLYMRLKAYFFEYKGDVDSADFYWKQVLDYVEKNEKALYYKSHRFLRYTEFLVRSNRIKEASSYALSAFEIAKRAQYKEFQLDAMQLLEQIASAQGDFKKAYQYKVVSQELELDLLKSSSQEGLLMMELQHEVDSREILQRKEEEARQAEMKASQLKANAFGVGLILFLILSGVIFRQYQLTNKEKNRSDDLLLNILPADTALELKNTGQTTARQYNEVTVLFCDIVGFTKVAELLSPQELVKEIDTYFRAFDDIIGKHGMEKIKTVGDAYVAVGGMPQHNKAKAKDVVNAAIEMLNKVNEFSLERNKDNRPAFQLRIGLHTGSVVAGVVGSKKFQYDIWGDAVNIAARMEQNSEPGKINISDVTYKVVKNDYNCIHRGKLEAKNKGLIDMYFVEFELS